MCNFPRQADKKRRRQFVFREKHSRTNFNAITSLRKAWNWLGVGETKFNSFNATKPKRKHRVNSNRFSKINSYRVIGLQPYIQYHKSLDQPFVHDWVNLLLEFPIHWYVSSMNHLVFMKKKRLNSIDYLLA